MKTENGGAGFANRRILTHDGDLRLDYSQWSPQVVVRHLQSGGLIPELREIVDLEIPQGKYQRGLIYADGSHVMITHEQAVLLLAVAEADMAAKRGHDERLAHQQMMAADPSWTQQAMRELSGNPKVVEGIIRKHIDRCMENNPPEQLRKERQKQFDRQAIGVYEGGLDEESEREMEREAKLDAEAKAKRAAEDKRAAEVRAQQEADTEAQRIVKRQAQRKAEAEAKRDAGEKAKRKAEADAEGKRKADGQARRKAEADAEAKAKRAADEKARRQAAAEAEAKAERDESRPLNANDRLAEQWIKDGVLEIMVECLRNGGTRDDLAELVHVAPSQIKNFMTSGRTAASRSPQTDNGRRVWRMLFDAVPPDLRGLRAAQAWERRFPAGKVDALCELLRGGMERDAACRQAGVDPDHLSSFLKKGSNAGHAITKDIRMRLQDALLDGAEAVRKGALTESDAPTEKEVPTEKEARTEKEDRAEKEAQAGKKAMTEKGALTEQDCEKALKLFREGMLEVHVCKAMNWPTKRLLKARKTPDDEATRRFLEQVEKAKSPDLRDAALANLRDGDSLPDALTKAGLPADYIATVRGHIRKDKVGSNIVAFVESVDQCSEERKAAAPKPPDADKPPKAQAEAPKAPEAKAGKPERKGDQPPKRGERDWTVKRGAFDWSGIVWDSSFLMRPAMRSFCEAWTQLADDGVLRITDAALHDLRVRLAGDAAMQWHLRMAECEPQQDAPHQDIILHAVMDAAEQCVRNATAKSAWEAVQPTPGSLTGALRMARTAPDECFAHRRPHQQGWLRMAEPLADGLTVAVAKDSGTIPIRMNAWLRGIKGAGALAGGDELVRQWLAAQGDLPSACRLIADAALCSARCSESAGAGPDQRAVDLHIRALSDEGMPETAELVRAEIRNDLGGRLQRIKDSKLRPHDHALCMTLAPATLAAARKGGWC